MSAEDRCATFTPETEISAGSRGFPSFLRFVDLYGCQVTVRASSLATQDALWVFVDGSVDDPTYENHGALHLCKEMAVSLRDALDRWITDAQHFIDDDEEEMNDDDPAADPPHV